MRYAFIYILCILIYKTIIILIYLSHIHTPLVITIVYLPIGYILKPKAYIIVYIYFFGIPAGIRNNLCLPSKKSDNKL